MEDLLTEKQLCEWLKISTMTAYRWRKEGLPYLGSSRSIRYDKEEVLKWLKKKGK